ncbi:MAG: AmmeMemoRadiSam system protein B [Variovorax sp.]|nr:AmmeMemoRadiSam system protein B [Variovorax sp.]
MPAVRHPAVEGLFYPAAPLALRRQVEGFLREIEPAGDASQPPPKLLIAPHAGYVYSGPIAASAYALLGPPHTTAIRRVVLLGPAHRVWVSGLAAPQAEVFQTPLGEIPIDREMLDRIADLPQVIRSDRAHAQEHSLEVHLPFLQAALGDFALLPLVVGDAGAPAVAEVLERLWGGDETLIVISSDLSHYLPYAQAQAADLATVQRILQFDAGLTPHEACGSEAINGALLVARRHGLHPRLLDLRNSGDTAGSQDRVVGYGAIAFEA